MSWPSLHYMEGNYSLIWYCQHIWQYQCQGTLYAGSHAGRANTRPPVAYISGADCNLWRITSGVCLGAHLFVKLKLSFCWKPCKSSGWPGHACQPSTTGGPPGRDLEGSTCNPQKGWNVEALDLQGLGEWPKTEQEQARELPLEWEHLFACSNLDLGRTTLIKHQIEVMDWTPFKEHYLCTPHMYDDVKAHLQQMLDIRPTWKLHSP